MSPCYTSDEKVKKSLKLLSKNLPIISKIEVPFYSTELISHCRKRILNHWMLSMRFNKRSSNMNLANIHSYDRHCRLSHLYVKVDINYALVDNNGYL